MSLNWTDKQDGIDDVVADDINSLASAIKESEANINQLNINVENVNIKTDQNDENVQAIILSVNEINDEIETVKNDVVYCKDGLLALANDRAPYEYVKEELSKKSDIEYVDVQLTKKVNTFNDEGGFEGGYSAASYNDGVSIGYYAKSEQRGVSIGYYTKSEVDGVSIGSFANACGDSVSIGTTTSSSGLSTAIGYEAKVTSSVSQAIQLGQGTNSEDKTFQVFDYQLLDANGNIPAERLQNASGGGSVDLSNYYTKDEIDDMLGSVGGNSFELMTLDEFNNLQGNNVPYEEYEGKAIEALAMAVYKEALNNHVYRIEVLENQIGAIDSALDEIIALQVEKGGDAE